MNKHKLNIHYRGSPWGSRTQQHAYCLRYAHSHHIESHLGKKQPQAKIAIAFLFGQLHFNKVTSHAPFYGGHLVMRSAKPGNHLKKHIFERGNLMLITSQIFDMLWINNKRAFFHNFQSHVQRWPWNPEFLHFLLSSTLLRGVEVSNSPTE